MAALLVAVGLLAVSVAGVSADDGDEEAAVAAIATELRPTRVAAEIPEGYGTLFPLQWGGGSLPQLKGRLADMGCAMNTLWLYDRDRWNGYNRYDLSYDFPTNQQFLQRYDQEVPAGRLYATCADQPVGNGLQPTQIIAEIPEGYDTMFELQWGGGSLLHLKGRLQTMGCVANNILIRNPDTNLEYAYSLYDRESTDAVNVQFTRAYERFIPPGPLQADCYDICETSDEGCLSFRQLQEREDNFSDSLNIALDLRLMNFELDKDVVCDDNFHLRIKEQVLPSLPIHPNTCIIKQIPFIRESRFNGTVISYPRLNTPPFIFLRGNYGYYRNDEEGELFLIYKEIHELCHINQVWHAAQAVGPELHFRYQDSHNSTYIFDYFNNSEHGKKFIDLIGFTNNRPRLDNGYFDNHGWYLSSGNIYRNIYSFSPIELSAELCSMYFLDKMGLESNYRYEQYYWTPTGKYKLGINIRDFDISPYLTSEVVEWLETYMILPEIVE